MIRRGGYMINLYNSEDWYNSNLRVIFNRIERLLEELIDCMIPFITTSVIPDSLIKDASRDPQQQNMVQKFVILNMELKEPAHSYQKKFYSVQEYLELEKDSFEKHEYYKGEIFAMAGAGSRHNVIFTNLFGYLFIALKGKNCRPQGSDMRIHIPENSLFTYPDISIICGEVIPSNEDEDTATQPTVVIEILSSSTKNYDRGVKFMLYRAIPALKDYILIDSETVHAEHFTINKEGLWQLKEYDKQEEKIFIEAINIELFIKDVYEGSKL